MKFHPPWHDIIKILFLHVSLQVFSEVENSIFKKFSSTYFFAQKCILKYLKNVRTAFLSSALSIKLYIKKYILYLYLQQVYNIGNET